MIYRIFHSLVSRFFATAPGAWPVTPAVVESTSCIVPVQIAHPQIAASVAIGSRLHTNTNKTAHLSFERTPQDTPCLERKGSPHRAEELTLKSVPLFTPQTVPCQDVIFSAAKLFFATSLPRACSNSPYIGY